MKMEKIFIKILRNGWESITNICKIDFCSMFQQYMSCNWVVGSNLSYQTDVEEEEEKRKDREKDIILNTK